ncbi:Trypsin [Popillia japonica]|uniref:Trypsin n=1 Tax=Popillia japonica TaxID=7064 RepID=A0AAW1IYS1_POPJA
MIFLIILPLLFTAILGNSTIEYIYGDISLQDGRIVGGAPVHIEDYPYQDISLQDGRIVGGAPVHIEDYPYQVSVQLLGFHYCGGAIISDQYILSAAHCYSGRLARYPYTVRAGSSYHKKGGQVVSVMKISTHPNYNKTAPTDSDISILQLASSLKFGSGVAPISLPEQNQAFADGTRAVVSGWGDLEEKGKGSFQLQAVWVPVVDNSKCESLYRVLGYKVTKSMVCAGYDDGGKDACQNDSGGPLVANGLLIGIVSWGDGCARPGALGVYADSGGPLVANGLLIGIVSWGDGCARPGALGVYASVSYLRSYITEITGI